MTADQIALAHLLAPEFVHSLTPLQRVILAHKTSVWARPEQFIPRGKWRWIFFRAGRGWGKTTYCIAPEINRLVRTGACSKIALVAPSEDRADDIQIQPLIDAAPPWFKPERYNDGIRWPNGVRGYVFSPGANYPRGSTFSHGWASELVDWQANTRVKTWEQLSLVIRKPGTDQKIFIDSTASGKSDLFALLERMHTADPVNHLIVNGTTFDNPLLSQKYLRSVCSQYAKGSRRYREEILGESFQESAGALWKHVWIDNNRRAAAPSLPTLRIVAWDPAGSGRADADEAGICVASTDGAEHYYVEADLTCRESMAAQAEIVCAAVIARKASGVVIERNHFNDGPRDLLTLVAAKSGLRVEFLTADRPFPSWRADVIYVREYSTRRNKSDRAEPVAKLYEENRVHHVGHHDTLETEMVTWEPDAKDSPNRLDACAYAVSELAAIGRVSTASEDMAAAARAHVILRERLAIAGKRQTI